MNQELFLGLHGSPKIRALGKLLENGRITQKLSHCSLALTTVFIGNHDAGRMKLTAHIRLFLRGIEKKMI